jgi:hypothetical protein
MQKRDCLSLSASFIVSLLLFELWPSEGYYGPFPSNALLLSSTIRRRLFNSGVTIVLSSTSHLVLIRACYEKSLSLCAILKR